MTPIVRSTASSACSSRLCPQSDEIEKTKWELMRVRFDDQMRGEKRKSAGSTVESQVTGTLKPWREVISPHKDVASGRYQQAEFAADLWQVHLGEGSPEYKDPKEFFRRTYLTASLSRLLADAVERLNGTGGDPVVQLQTNFGGGKTHSMLALYHLCSGAKPGELLGMDKVMEAAGCRKASESQAYCDRWKQNLSWSSIKEAGRNDGEDHLGRTRLAAQEASGLRSD